MIGREAITPLLEAGEVEMPLVEVDLGVTAIIMARGVILGINTNLKLNKKAH